MSIEKLAKELNTTLADMKFMVEGVVNSMKKDGLTCECISNADKIKLALAYAQSQQVKVDRITTRYLTDKAFSDDIKSTIFLTLKGV